MSYTEAWHGKFKILAVGNEKVLKKVEEIGLKEDKDYLVEKFGDKIEYIESQNNKYEFIRICDKVNTYYRQYVMLEMIELEQEDDSEQYTIHHRENDIISFNTRFYNGCWCLVDSFEEIVSKIVK